MFHYSSRFLPRPGARRAIAPEGHSFNELRSLRRAFRVVPQSEIDETFIKAVTEALRDHELRFWEELFEEAGEDDCVFWMKLVGLYEPQCIKIINALWLRSKGRPDKWLKLTEKISVAPKFREDLDFKSDETCGLMMWFA